MLVLYGMQMQARVAGKFPGWNHVKEQIWGISTSTPRKNPFLQLFYPEQDTQ